MSDLILISYYWVNSATHIYIRPQNINNKFNPCKKQNWTHQSVDIHIGIYFPLFLSFLLPTLSSCFFFIMFLFFLFLFSCYFFSTTLLLFFLLLFFRDKIVTFFPVSLSPSILLPFFPVTFFPTQNCYFFFLLPFFLLLSFRAPYCMGPVFTDMDWLQSQYG